MAYDPNEEEQKRAQLSAAGGTVVGGGGGGGQGIAAAPPTNIPGTGSGFVSLGNYLGLNRAAAQGMGDKVLGNIGGAADQIRQKADAESQKTVQAAQAGTPQGAQENAAYAGPNNANNVYSLAGDVEKYNENVGQLSTMGGRSQLLQQQGYKAPTQGGRTLNTALFSGANADRIAPLVSQRNEQVSALRGHVATRAGDAEAAIRGGQQGAAQSRQAWQDYVKEQEAKKAETERLRLEAEDASRSEEDRRKARERYNGLVQGVGTAFMPLLGAPGLVGAGMARLNKWFGKK